MGLACNSHNGNVPILYLLQYWFGPLKPIHSDTLSPIYIIILCLTCNLNVCGFGPFGIIERERERERERSKGIGVALLSRTGTPFLHDFFLLF